MNILLISSNLAEEPHAVFPLGLGVVAHSLREKGHTVELFDSLCEKDCSTTLSNTIERINPSAIGIGIRNIDNVNFLNPVFYLDDVVKLVNEIRNCSTVPIFAGGAGFSLMPEMILEYIGADFGVVGAAETAVCNLIDSLEKGDAPSHLIHGHTDSKTFGQCDYDEEITRFYLAQTGMLPIQTKRGCPKKCVYCSYPQLEGSSVIGREPDAVIDEVLFLQKKFTPDLVYFTDSIFNDSKHCYLDLIEKMAKRDLSIPWCAFFTPELFDKETITLMKRTGLKTVELGADAYTDKTLAGLGKDYDFSTIYNCCEALKNADVTVSCSYIAGGPGERRETLKEGIENIKKIYWASAFIFMGIRILPGTAIERIALKEGVLSENNNLLKPAFYLSPEIDEHDLFDGLSTGFDDVHHAIFPPHSRNEELKLFRKLQRQSGKAR